MVLSESMMRRLAFVRYLYNVAVAQSQQPEPLNAVSVLTFHDSIELFLYLASRHYDLKKDDIRFMEYWEVLSTKMKQELGHREEMRRLNAARVALKHKGIFPSRLDLEAFRASAGCVSYLL